MKFQNESKPVGKHNINNLGCHIGWLTTIIKCQGNNEFTPDKLHLIQKKLQNSGDTLHAKHLEIS